MSAWSQTTNNVALLFNDNTPSKTTNPETGISVQATPHTEDYHSAWKVYGANALELSVPQGYVITGVEFEYSGFFENGDCIDQCNCLIFDTESETWVQKDGKLDYFSTIKFNAEHPAYVSAVFVYYHRCSGATHYEAVNATCTTKGKAEYWECTCGKIYSDADCTHEVTDMTSLDTDIDPTNHSEVLEEHDAVEATCTEDGNVHYWHCNGCGKNFETKDAENEIADVTISKEQGRHLHPTYVEAKDATDTEIGYTVNHWHCQDCGKNFEDQECTKPITDNVIIPITGTLNYLCFTANAVGSTVELKKNGDAYNVILQYSTDYCKNWKSVNFESRLARAIITLEKVNDKVYFRNQRSANEVSGFSKDYSYGFNNYQFVMSGSIAASGNVMSLVDKDVETTTIPNKYCFIRLFYKCEALTSAPELPATTLAEGCYNFMFEECTSLKTAPALPATNLAKYCYENMFWGCANLTSAPELPATTLAHSCYENMFWDCANLKSAPALPATTLNERCYKGMFYGCESLTEAPDLPATTLCTDCYEQLFDYCTNLKSIKVGFTDWNNNAYIWDWLSHTADKGMFICPDELSAKYDDEYGIPCNWTKVFEVKANNEPKTENYYATFYSGKNAYEVPEGVTAYTGKVEDSTSEPNTSVLKLTAIEDGIIPASQGVILRMTTEDNSATKQQIALVKTTATGTWSGTNALTGTDEATTLGENQYALSYGQNGVGFYLWNGKSIDAHKAYLTLSSGAKAFTFEFNDEPSGIKETFEPYNGTTETYNLNGMRVGKDYKGIVVVRGKKYLKK